MLISSQKKYYQLQSLKSSFLKSSKTGISEHDSIVKKVALTIINLLLLPFRATYSAYCKLFKVKIKPETGLFNNFVDAKTAIKELITKHKPTVIKTALIGIGISSLVAFGYKPSRQSSQSGLLVDIIDSFVKFIPSNMLPYSALGIGTGLIIYKSLRNFLVKIELNKITRSQDCRDALEQILNSHNLSYHQKLNSIKTMLRAEVKEIAEAQLNFAKNLVDQIGENFSKEQLEQLSRLTRNRVKTETELEYKLLESLTPFFNFNPELAKKANLLNLKDSEKYKELSNDGELTNLEILELDFSMESVNSIISFVEGIRKTFNTQNQ